MKRNAAVVGAWAVGLFAVASLPLGAEEVAFRVGIIGLDSSHSVAFTRLLNDAAHPQHVAGARVVAAYRGGSPDVQASAERIDGFTSEMRDTLGVEIVPTIEELVAKTDALMILSVDGRAHLAQARAAFGRGKPVFIDKPLAASLRDGREILRVAAVTKTPLFSASATRFYPSVLQVKADPSLGEVLGAEAYSPAKLEPHHPDLFWYGVHAVEMLYAIMGPGCQEVTRWQTPDTELVVGRWKDGRLGTVRGIRRDFHKYGVTVFGPASAQASACATRPDDYQNLVRQIVTFFETKTSPVGSDEMLEVLAFMQAAQVSRERGGRAVSLRAVH
jgi:hypothetical protein